MGLLERYRNMPTRFNKIGDYTKQAKAIDKNDQLIDQGFMSIWRERPFIIEQKILEYVINRLDLKVYIEYLERISLESGTRAIATPEDSRMLIFMDEVFDNTVLGMYLTVFAGIYHQEKLFLCREYFHYLVHRFLREDIQADARFRYYNVAKEIGMCDKAIQQACDSYWNVWTFMAGHELYHVQNMDIPSCPEDEFQADKYGYSILLTMIEDQKHGLLPRELDCFYEEYYLMPCSLLYLFKIIAEKQLNGRIREDTTHPAPEERFNKIIDMYDDLPDDIDTTNGNAMLAAFLDAVDQLC